LSEEKNTLSDSIDDQRTVTRLPIDRDLFDFPTIRVEPTLDEYLASYGKEETLERQSFYGELFEVVLQLKPQFKNFDISMYEFMGALDGDTECVEVVCHQLLSALKMRRDMEAAGNAHVQSNNLAISDSLLNYLILIIFEAMIGRGAPCLPASLFVLIREQLGGVNNKHQKSFITNNRKKQALWIGLSLFREGEILSLHKVAKTMGVEASTVQRWYPGGKLMDEVKKWDKLLRTQPRKSSPPSLKFNGESDPKPG